MAARSVLCGLIGDGIDGSFSPTLHEAEGRAQGMNYVYRLLDLERLHGAAASVEGIIDLARQWGFDGLNVTHPYKQQVMAYLDELSPDAARLEAVNTVVFTGGRAVGHNTDWTGFGSSLSRELPGASLDRVVQIGAGGAGVAVAYSALTRGAGHLTVTDVDLDRAEHCRDTMRKLFPGSVVDAVPASEIAGPLAAASGLINATPIGMVGFPGTPVSADVLRPDLWVADVIYRPIETPLIRAARALGAPTLGGAGMNVFQAADAFELFTGVTPDFERMYAHVLALVEQQSRRAA